MESHTLSCFSGEEDVVGSQRTRKNMMSSSRVPVFLGPKSRKSSSTPH